MKVFNLVGLAYGGAFVLIMALALLAESLLEKETATMIMIPTGLLIGMSARRVTEKILGYTLYDALKEGSNDNL